MAQRSQRKLAAMRAERAEATTAKRRRELTRKYPEIPPQVWANMGAGLCGSGAGAKALREWLDSVRALFEDRAQTRS